MTAFAATRPDILVFDAAGTPCAVVEVKSNQAMDERTKQQAAEWLRASGARTEYLILVDRDNIRVYRWDGRQLCEPPLQLSTSEVLSFYDHDFPTKKVYERYLTALVEAWLRDVAYHWKSDQPPALGELTAIGVAQKIRDGSTSSTAILRSSDGG